MGATTANEIKVTDRVDPVQWQDYLESHAQSCIGRGALPSTGMGRRIRNLRIAGSSIGCYTGGHDRRCASPGTSKEPAFGNHLVSLPWFDAAGIIADDRRRASLAGRGTPAMS